MTPNSPNEIPPVGPSDPRAGGNERLDALAEEFVAALSAGSKPSIDLYVAQHPDLAPELERRLKLIEMVFRASESLREPGGSAIRVDLERARGASRRFVCPHCGGRIQVVGHSLQEVTCGSCGSVIEIDPDATTVDHLSSLPRQLGRFRLQRVLGQGAFGTVFLADDPQLGRQVAIKIPRRGYFADEREEQRFLREAKHAARLRHPHIVQVHEISVFEGIAYIVSEFIPGLTLADRLTGPDMSFREAAQLMVQIAAAVEYAHENGVIHRDLKPSNILLDEQIRPYVTDFGLAKREDAEATITLDGVVMGTPAYMSPEQATGNQQSVGPPSDVYSLGVILYRLLCHDLPFHGSKRMLLYQVLHDEPAPPTRLNRNVPADLETITLKALAKQPAERYATAQAFADDLSRWLRHEPIRARPISPLQQFRRWCMRNPTVATLAGLLALVLAASTVLAGLWALHANRLRNLANDNAIQADQNRQAADARNLQLLWHQGDQALRQNLLAQSAFWYAQALPFADQPVQRTRLGLVLDRLPKLVGIWSSPASADVIRFDRAGTQMVVGSSAGAIRVYDLTSQELRAATNVEPFSDLEVSGDGNRNVCFGKQQHAFLWDLESGAQRKLGHAGFVVDAEFSPDAKMVATAGFDAAARIWNAADGTKIHERRFEGKRVVAVRFIDDQQLAVLTQVPLELESELSIWRISDDQLVASGMTIESNVAQLELSANRERVLLANDRGAWRVWELPSGALVGSAIEHNAALRQVDLGADGSLVRAVDASGTFVAWKFADGEWQSAGSHFTSLRPNRAAANPQRSVIALSTGQGLARFYRCGDGREVACGLTIGEDISALCFAPDGRRCAVGGRDGQVQLWDLAGAAATKHVIRHEGPVRQARFLAGDAACVTTGIDGKLQFVTASDGQLLGPPLEHGGPILDCDVSPSGERVATAGDDQQVIVWDAVARRPIGKPLPHSAAVTQVRFSGDSARLVTGCSDGSVSVWDANAGLADTPKPLFAGQQGGMIRCVAFSPAGDQIAAASMDRTVRCWEWENRREVMSPIAFAEFASFCQFLPDGQSLFAGGARGKSGIWKLADGSLVTDLPAVGEVTSAWISPDGNRLVAADMSGRARGWVRVDGAWRIDRVYQHPELGELYYAEYSGDGNMLIAGGIWTGPTGEPGESGGVLLFEAGSGRLLAPPWIHGGLVRRVYLNAAGTRALSSSFDQTAVLWEIAPVDQPAERVIQLASLYAQQRMTATGELRWATAEEQVELFADLRRDWPEMFRCDPAEIENWMNDVNPGQQAQASPD